MLTLELVNSEGDIADYFCFPVMPDSITKTEQEITNVRKTAGGVVSFTTSSFTPQDLSISGNFGRSFKVLLGNDLIDFKAFGESLGNFKENGFNNVVTPFNVKVKTGYGCTKILQNIVNKSKNVDALNKPYRLFLHNPTLGEAYLVEKMSLTLKQDKSSSNMMWGYSLNFKIIGDAKSIGYANKSSLGKVLGKGVLQKTINKLAGSVGETVRKGASDPPIQGNLDKIFETDGGTLGF
jgi:hypothetical protein